MTETLVRSRPEWGGCDLCGVGARRFKAGKIADPRYLGRHIGEVKAVDYTITLDFRHRIRFTHGAFHRGNSVLREIFAEAQANNRGFSVLVLLEEGVADAIEGLEGEIRDYLGVCPGVERYDVVRVVGGEEAKSSLRVWQRCLDEIERADIDRHSWVIAVGGGAFLDVTGFAAAVAHRGIRYVRFPTTTLAQDDSGVGVKNGINAFRKKNFLGTFAVPYAVINDLDLLHYQPEGIRRGGLVEAVKVAMVKDGEFYQWIRDNAQRLERLEKQPLEECVMRSALLHAEHIVNGGDPFEWGSSRPLDYGHWTAHKLEQMSDHRLTHAEAVAIGVAIDCAYGRETGLMEDSCCREAIRLLIGLGLPVWDALLDECQDVASAVFGELWGGLDEFRQHLGGELTVLMVEAPGKCRDIHELDREAFRRAIVWLSGFRQSV